MIYTSKTKSLPASAQQFESLGSDQTTVGELERPEGLANMLEIFFNFSKK